jgi:hypothetical protein
MTYDELIPLMGTDWKLDGDWKMQWCPAHNDGAKNRKRSLGLSSTGVLRCFAGCTEGKDGFKNVLAMLRAREGVQEHKPLPATPVDYTSRHLVDVYDYRSPDNKLFAQKGRFEPPAQPKEFKWRQPHAQQWGGVSLDDAPLWGSETIASMNPDDWIVFCEGEKAVKACRAAGMNAVCHGGGSSTRKFGDSLLVLQNRKIALWPDNDEPGRKYMMAVQRELLKNSIPADLFVISAPVPPKGDAHEYFVDQKGSVEDLFKNNYTQPHVELITRDYIKVTIQTNLGPVAFHFDGLIYETRSLACEFTVEIKMPVTTQEQYCKRAENILSNSWGESTCRNLKNMYGDNNWTLALNAAISRARTALISAQRSVQLSDGSADVDDMPQEMDFRIESILAEGQSTCIFADGDSGKTWLSYAMGLTVATGTEFLGLRVKQGNVLIADWETDEGQARRRMKRLLKAQSIQRIPDNIYYHPGDGIPLSEHVESLRRLVREKNIDLIIIDSGAPACGGDPSDPRTTIAFFNALARLNCSVIVIVHVNKMDAKGGTPDKPFGSAFWHNMSRRTFFLGYDKPTTDIINMAAVCKKSNDGRRPAPLSFKLTFTGNEGIGPALIEPISFRSVPAFEVFLPATERLWLMLNTEGQPLMFVDIMKRLNWMGDEYSARLQRILKWGKENGWFEQVIEPNKQIRWRSIGEGPTHK